MTIPTVPDTHRDLLDAANAATFITVDAQGRPQATAVWYVADEQGRWTTSLTSERQKFKNISANPEVVVFIIDPANMFHTLEIRGTVEIVPDPDFSGLQRICDKYDTPIEHILEMGRDRSMVTVIPRRIVANG